MTDVRDIIYYIKSLKKGFDKDLFQNKIDELAFIVDNGLLNYTSFHTLFQVWLNLSIPFVKWVSLGNCLVPKEQIGKETVEYAIAWLLSSYGDQAAAPRIGFVLDWLTAAMDCEHIDMIDLDMGYQLFYSMLTYEVYTANVMKLVYTLTKPIDVTRENVVELLSFAKKRMAKKNMYRQLQVLLGLFKSYRPQCVPEDIPAISIHTSFKKVNPTLMERFRKCQERRHSLKENTQYLLWINPLTEKVRNKNAPLLVPNIEFSNIGVKRNADREPKKNFLDFSDPVSLLQYSLQHSMSRPAKLRALLCNETGLVLLAVVPDADQEFFTHDLHHLLTSTFLDVSPHTTAEKSLLLRRLSAVQCTLMQGIPAVTRVLAQLLPLWDENTHFAEILDLVQWLSIDSEEQVSCIITSLRAVYWRSTGVRQCAILHALTNCYCNMVYTSTRLRRHFSAPTPAQADHSQLLKLLGNAINDMCDKGLQISPDDIRVAFSSARTINRMASTHIRRKVAVNYRPQILAPLLALVAPSAALLDQMAGMLILQKKLLSIAKSRDFPFDHDFLRGYLYDIINCLYNECCISSRESGLYFNKLNPKIADKLVHIIPSADTELSIRNSLAFAPYTYVQLGAINHEEATNKLWFEATIDQEFNNISKLLKTTLPELRA